MGRRVSLVLMSPCTRTKVAIVLLKNAAGPAGAVDVVTPLAAGFPGDETLRAEVSDFHPGGRCGPVTVYHKIKFLKFEQSTIAISKCFR